MIKTWIIEGEKYVGQKEIPGKNDNPIIQKWLLSLKAWWKDDETPWCGTFVAHCLKESGYKVPKHWYRAKGYLDWGIPIKQPVHGCVAVFERKGGGHVGFVVGRDFKNRLVVLGGNQGNQVSFATFDQTRVIGYRWPSEVGYTLDQLPVFVRNDMSSTDEA